MSISRPHLGRALFLMLGTSAVLGAGTLVFAQEQTHMDHAQHIRAASSAVPTVPTMPGQEAFGTIQEIVRMLEDDLQTDCSRVNISALREHLIDMDEVTCVRMR